MSWEAPAAECELPSRVPLADASVRHSFGSSTVTTEAQLGLAQARQTAQWAMRWATTLEQRAACVGRAWLRFGGLLQQPSWEVPPSVASCPQGPMGEDGSPGGQVTSPTVFEGQGQGDETLTGLEPGCMGPGPGFLPPPPSSLPP